jgi:hypothetical protein
MRHAAQERRETERSGAKGGRENRKETERIEADEIGEPLSGPRYRVRIPASPPVKLFYPLIFLSETLPVSKMSPKLCTDPRRIVAPFGSSSSRIAASRAAGVRCM